ncbi:MAG: glycoside hydrolase family 1 protein [Candidatus Omnitrophica bacterium]|nr:glycoside hydrolase family 1 protein [Candidatus Omnitrophota bacterium]
MNKFPQAFLWGAATAAHQVEGQNIYNDWWQAEQEHLLKEASNSACKHYELYPEDFTIARQLNHNCHRFSIEWSRIEPQEGNFQASEIEHYRKVVADLRSKGLEPVVTLHHFTNPVWFSRKGGWTKFKQQKYFLRFVDRMVRELAGQVKFWITINEPLVYSSHSYFLGVWPPKEHSLFKTIKVTLNLAGTHIKAYRIIHGIYRQKNLTKPMVGIAANLQAFEICQPTLKNKLAACLRDKLYNFYFIEKILHRKTLDYIGVNYYSRNLVDVNNWGIRGLLSQTCQFNHHPLPKNSLGWDIYPEGLFKLLMALKKYKLPVLITENGICTEDDNLRWDYIYRHLLQLHRAIAGGVEVLGYIYWSLIDNFEWDKGFSPRFGLVHIDYQNQKRSVKQSAMQLAEVIKKGEI